MTYRVRGASIAFLERNYRSIGVSAATDTIGPGMSGMGIAWTTLGCGAERDGGEADSRYVLTIELEGGKDGKSMA